MSGEDNPDDQETPTPEVKNDEKKKSKRRRSNARRKFTRLLNVLDDRIGSDKVRLELLHKELEDAFCDLENANTEYLMFIDSDDGEFEEADKYMETAYRNRYDAGCRIHSEDTHNERVTPAISTKTINVKKLDAPKFSGKIRDYPTFKRDYKHYMEPNYGNDSYALRSCLSGKALDTVLGVDDDYGYMWKRLDTVFGDTEKIVDAILFDLKSLVPVKEGDSIGLIALVNTAERCWQDLRKLNLEQEMNTSTMTSIVEKLLPNTQKREWTLYKQASDVGIPALEDDFYGKFGLLLKYLLKERDALEYMNDRIRESDVYTRRGGVHANDGALNDAINSSACLTSLQQSVEELTKMMSNFGSNFGSKLANPVLPEQTRCWVHNTDSHDVTECNVFCRLPNEEKVNMIKQNRVCFRCLQKGHLSRNCASRKLCNVTQNEKICNKAHHPLLHDDSVFGSLLHTNRNGTGNPCNTLLMITTVKCPIIPINAILDPCSNFSLITFKAARKLNLHGRAIKMSLTKVGNVTENVATKEYDMTIHDNNNKRWTIKVYGIEEITSPITPVNVSSIENIFRGIKVSDVERPVGTVELLLGLDCCRLLPDKIAESGNLQLMKGPLGHCLRGSHPSLKFSSDPQAGITVHFTKIAVDDEISRFFNIESLGTLPPSMLCKNCQTTCDNGNNNITIKEGKELDMIKEGLNYDEEKCQWNASYPWIKDPKLLPNNFPAAYGQLISLEKRLKRAGQDNLEGYQEQIRDMLNRGVIRKLTRDEIRSHIGPIHYVPHHAVLKPSSDSTPRRIVFNSSSVYMGHKLNDYWAKGPDILNSLLGVHLRFRENAVAIQGDISKMYNCITINELEQHTHRFLWRDMYTDKPPDTYIPLVVMFGDKPSGAIAMTAMHLTADMHKDIYPKAAKTITRNSYVDDILKSTSSRQMATELIREINYVLGKGGFKVKSWIISGNETSNCTSVPVTDTDETMTLGLRWKPKEDVFAFKHEVITLPMAATKSHTVGKLSCLFDPSGLVIPFTLKAKLCIRDISITQRDWKEPVSEDIIKRSQQFLNELHQLEEVYFTRCLKPSNAVGDPTLVVFCDASELAYGACAYIRWECDNGTYYTYLICAKNRLAPLKTITIPRLELCAAVIGSRLKVTIYEELDYNFTKTYFITDSRIVQAQIYKESYKFGIFVANRITEIQKNSCNAEWYWTNSKNNVADLTTRPTDLPKLNSYWKEGPDYLRTEIEHWPIDTEIDSTCDLPDVKATINVNVRRWFHKQNLSDFDLNRFSELQTLLRVTAMVFKISKIKTFNCGASKVNSDDVNYALDCWIKFIQNNSCNRWEQDFKRLAPKLDGDGRIIVGSRIANWLRDNYERDYLILLPTKSKFSELIVTEAHSINHDGIDSTIARIREKYWIPRLRKIVKSVRSNCYKCRIVDKVKCSQQMGQLPIERLKPSPPFFYAGVDLFGPVYVKDVVKKRTRMKNYGIIFNCLTTRAIYLDVASGYDTENFLLVLRRFVSIYGCPKQLRSDAGSQIISANKEWERLFGDTEKINKFGLRYGMDWMVNKSADAPWENGCTERLIKSVKRCIELTIGNNILSFPELQTVFFECANILNSRPIGCKDGDSAYFCPNDLILGRTSIRVPQGKFDMELNQRKRFEFIECLITNFWKRWHVHYFENLIIRQKWHVERRNLRVGDIVLVPDSKALRGNWKLAEVSVANPGSDGKVRDVELRYKNQDDSGKYTGVNDTTIKRSVHRLVLIIPQEER